MSNQRKADFEIELTQNQQKALASYIDEARSKKRPFSFLADIKIQDEDGGAVERPVLEGVFLTGDQAVAVITKLKQIINNNKKTQHHGN